MNNKTKIGFEILQTALLLGILGDVLLRSDEPGLNVLLVLCAVTAAMVMLFLRHRKGTYDGRTWALQGALVFFAAMFAWRDSQELRVWDVFAIFGIGAVLILPSLRIKVHLAGFSHYILGIIVSGLNVFFAPFFLMMSDIKWSSPAQKGLSRHLISVLRGLLIAAPLLLIFGGLFKAADAVFEGVVNRTFNVVPDVVISHIFLTVFFTWVTAGYLRGSLFEIFAFETVDMGRNAPSAVVSVTEPVEEKAETETATAKEEEKPKQRNWQDFDNSLLPKVLTLGGVETAIVLGLLDLLFLSFVIIQIPYLFGGMDLVQNTPDFKLAEFARRGFGELVAVSALVLPILLVSHWLLRKDRPVNEKLFRVLAGIQIVLLFVIMASAAQRLLLLTGPVGYGLTTVRFYPMAFMIWLAVVFCWFAVTVLRGARQHFAWGMIWSALFILGALHFVNPDAFIVRTNLRLMQQGREFDASYNAHLSADSVPVLMKGLPAMNPEQQVEVRSILSTRTSIVCTGEDFRNWNWSRSVARSLIHEQIGPTPNGTCSGL
jgi:hypothetical protein